MPKTDGNFAHITLLAARSACDLNPTLLLGGAILGGLAATVVLLGWTYLHKKRLAGSSKSIGQ